MEELEILFFANHSEFCRHTEGGADGTHVELLDFEAFFLEGFGPYLAETSTQFECFLVGGED